MRRYRKSILLLVLVIFLASSVFIMSGCYADPADVGTWYIQLIRRGDEQYFCNDEFDGELLFTDSWVWTFNGDGEVEIVALDGTKVSGTYTRWKERGDNRSSHVTVTLENGAEFTGTCGRFMFDGSWHEFSLTDGDITIYFDEDYNVYNTHQSYLDRLAAEEAQDRNSGKLPLEKRENAEDLFYLYSIEYIPSAQAFIINDTYNGEILTPKYVVFELSESGFTADYADGSRIEATFVSYEWNAPESRNVYLAEGEDGKTYKIYYTAEDSSDEICRIYVEDVTDGVTYALLTQSQFLSYSLYLPLELRSNAGELFYLYSASQNGDYDGSLGKDYLVIDLRTDGFTAVFSDGKRIEADFTSYRWEVNLYFSYNSYEAEAADGNVYTLSYHSSFDRVDSISMYDSYNNVLYELRTEYWFNN